MPEPIDLNAIDARANAATPSPWEEGDGWVYTEPVYDDDNRLSNVCGMSFSDPERAGVERERAQRNVRFIAHARKDVPALLAEVRRLRSGITEAIREVQIGSSIEAEGILADLLEPQDEVTL
jgi:hypothetical protein